MSIAAPPAQSKNRNTTRNLHFAWDNVAGASYYRLMYSVGSGSYQPAMSDLPGATNRATVSVSAHLARRPSLRYTVAACTTSGCAESSGISPHLKPIAERARICGAGAAFGIDPGVQSDAPAPLVCMERVSARFYARRRFR